MNLRTCSLALAGGVVPLVLFSPSAFAQEDDLGGLVNKGLAAMNAEKWDEALKYNSEAVTRFGKNNPMQLFGPQFGVIYYRKGISEMKLKKWNDAMQSFETCHEKFPNAGKPGGGIDGGRRSDSGGTAGEWRGRADDGAGAAGGIDPLHHRG